jgi:hypothetical protein
MKNHFNIVGYTKLLEKEKILETKGYSFFTILEVEINEIFSGGCRYLNVF